MNSVHSHDQPWPRGRRSAGFTLVEVVLATTIAVGMVLMLATATIQTADQTRRMEDDIDRSARVRLVLDLLVSDLQSAVLRRDENVWFAVDILKDTSNSRAWQSAPGQKPKDESLQLEPKPRDHESGGDGKKVHPEDFRFGVGGMWLRFITTAEDRAIYSDGDIVSGDINAVAYQLVRRRLEGIGEVKNDENASYQLFRSIVRADRTFDEGYQVDTYRGPSVHGMPGELKSPGPDSVVCDQIIDFGVIIHQRNEDGAIVQGFPHRDPSLDPLEDPLRYRSPRDGVPERIEVMVRVISATGARELRVREQTDLTGDEWWRIAFRESRVYSRTLSLPGSL